MRRVSDDQDALLWWRENANRFPVLARIARRFLCVPATSAPSERVWSAAGEIVGDRRSRLTDASAEALIFCHENIEYCNKVAESLCPEFAPYLHGVFASQAGSGNLLKPIDELLKQAEVRADVRPIAQQRFGLNTPNSDCPTAPPTPGGPASAQPESSKDAMSVDD
jgi:hypothetical protein